ncbi:UNVERIFIED_ORG: tRNA(Ile)-lysidine synthase [Shinella zoogloeoides]|nr:tRNA(Ile)-lysidine synthase [Shinella zoogloeoides]
MARADDSVIEAADRLLKSFKRPATLLVAVSGGSDSLGLLLSLAELCATGDYPGIRLRACTVDHDLRAGSAEEAQGVAQICARLGVAHVTRRWSGPKPQAGLQAAARASRYALLVDAAGETGADAILSAHTLDDQRETVAMRASRSKEGIGLSGMADAVLLEGAIWLLRPFLGIGRAEIRSFLGEREQGWIDDPSNSNPKFERVRVRSGDDPRLSATEPGRRFSLAVRGADFLRDHVQATHETFTLSPNGVRAALGDPAAWRALLLLAATAGGRPHIIEARAAGRLRAFLASDTLSRLTAGRVVFDRRRDGLHLYRECRDVPVLAVPAASVALWDGRYRLANRTDRAIVVTASGEGAGQGLHGPALRAASAAPSLIFEDGARVPDGAVRLERVIAPYTHFLPRFDLPLAQTLAALCGRLPFPAPPNE